MKDISQLPNEFDRFVRQLNEELIDAHQISVRKMKEVAKETAEIPFEARRPSQFEPYIESIDEKTEVSGNEITSSVYSDLLVGGTSKWANVPLGAFLEWGTGPLGETTNEYDHGYPYTDDEPWDFHTLIQYAKEGTWGIRARPHMYPAFMMSLPDFSIRISEAIKKAWKR